MRKREGVKEKESNERGRKREMREIEREKERGCSGRGGKEGGEGGRGGREGGEGGREGREGRRGGREGGNIMYLHGRAFANLFLNLLLSSLASVNSRMLTLNCFNS